jgi:hypothetical protein
MATILRQREAEMDVELQECRVLRIERGDIIVFETQDRLTPEMATTIKGQLQGCLAAAGHGDVATMIITGGATLTKTQIAVE